MVGDALTIVCVNDQQPRSVYIDINHWYALARADDGKPDKPEHAAILRKLLAEVDAGRLVVPLSSVTYTELTENPRDQLRQPASGVMLKLSRLATIAPAQKIVDEELARELNRRFGRPAFPIKVPKLGRGVGFAFGVPGRVKATGFTDAERERIEAQMGKTIADLELEVNAQFEYRLLATPRSLRNRIPGFEPAATRTDAAAELAEIQVMVDTLHSAKEIATRPMDGVAARQLCRDIFDNFTQALKSGGFVNGSPMHTSGGADRLPRASADPAGGDVAQVPLCEADRDHLEDQPPAGYCGPVGGHSVHRRRGHRRRRAGCRHTPCAPR